MKVTKLKRRRTSNVRNKVINKRVVILLQCNSVCGENTFFVKNVNEL